MAQDSFYFKHDLNARSDRKWSKLIRAHGYRAFGIGWAVIERIYEEGGRLPDDEELLAYELRLDPAIDTIDDLRAVLASDLFYRRDGIIGSESVDRRLAAREEVRKAQSLAGKKSALARVEQALNGRSSQLNQKGRKEGRKDITTAGASPAAVDEEIEKASTKASERLLDAKLEDARLPFNFGPFQKGVRIQDLPDAACREIAAMPRIGKELGTLLKRRIAQQAAERFRGEREARR